MNEYLVSQLEVSQFSISKVLFTGDNHIKGTICSQTLCQLCLSSSAFCLPFAVGRYVSLGGCFKWTESLLNTLEYLQ